MVMAAMFDAKIFMERYAEALFSLVVEEGTLGPMCKEIEALKNMLAEHKHVQAVFLDPILTEKKQSSFIEGLAEKAKLSKTLLNFLKLMSENRRLRFIDIFFVSWTERVENHEKRKTVLVESAKKLSEDQKTRLKNKIEKKISAKIVIREEIRPEFLGGMKIKIDNVMVDFSVQTQLSTLQLAMEKE
jgi:F-type H+-transporting ATPase subunit delta